MITFSSSWLVMNETCFAARFGRLVDYGERHFVGFARSPSEHTEEGGRADACKSYLNVFLAELVAVNDEWIVIHVGIACKRKRPVRGAFTNLADLNPLPFLSSFLTRNLSMARICLP